jgi:hypothetical protein
LPDFFEKQAIDCTTYVHHFVSVGQSQLSSLCVALGCYEKIIQGMYLVLTQQLGVVFEQIGGDHGGLLDMQRRQLEFCWIDSALL